MKKTFLLIVITLITLTNFSYTYAYNSKWRDVIWMFGSNLYRNDYEKLYEILDKYNDKKISLDDCVISGIKYLNDKEAELTSKTIDNEYTLNIKKNSPMKFIAFIYANYSKLAPQTTKEIQSSLWDLTPYLNRSFTSNEIELLTSGDKPFCLTRNKKTIKCHDLIDAFQKLVDKGYMTKAEAAVHMSLILKIGFYIPHALPPKYNIKFDDFWQTESNITGWIHDNRNEIIVDKKAFRAIEIILSNFNFELKDYIELLKTGSVKPIDSEQNDDYIVKQKYPEINAQTPEEYIYFKKVFKIAETIKKYHSTEKLFGTFYTPIPWNRGGWLYGKKLYIEITKFDDTPMVAGRAELKNDDISELPVSAHITLNGDYIQGIGGKNWIGHFYHEYFHTCQYSYTKEKENWYSSGTAEEVLFAMDGTATLMTDIALIIHSSQDSTFMLPTPYTPEYISKYLKYLDPSYSRRKTPYEMVSFFYYILEKKLGIGLFDINGSMIKQDINSVTVIENIWKAIELKQSVFEAIRSYSYYGDTYLIFFHKFNIDNVLFHYGITSTYEGVKSKFLNYPPTPEGEFQKIKYDSETISISIDSDSVKYCILYPPESKPTFKRFTIVSINGLKKECNTVTAIEIIDNGKDKPTHNPKTLPIIDGKCYYELYTQNDYIQNKSCLFNWTKVIFVLTNASGNPTKANITCSAEVVKPDEFSSIYNRQKNFDLSKQAGNEYRMTMTVFYSKWRSYCIEAENEIIKLISLYQSPVPVTPSSTIVLNPIILNQFIEKYKVLNTAMQEAIVSVHDLRYQFYLRKNYIVSKICEGATASSVLAQLKRLKEYQDDINTALNASNDKIISVIGATVADHAMAFLMNTKNPLNPGWSDEENKLNQTVQSVKSKIQNTWKKSPYYLNPNEVGDAFSAVGNPEFEIVFQMSGNKPAPVNLPPNLKNEVFAKDAVYNVSDTIKKFTAVNYKEYLFGDVCDPMDWKYFSVIKKHDYREEFMPPQPGSPSYFRELNEIGYFRINAHKYEYENVNLTPPDVISAVSRKFEDFKRRTIDAIIIQLHKGQFDLLSEIKKNIATVSAKDELITILKGALAEIKGIQVIENTNIPISQTTEKIDEILALLNK